MRYWYVGAFLFAAQAGVPAVAQQQPPAATDRAAAKVDPRAGSPDDIVVEGYRLRKDLDTIVRYPTAISTKQQRYLYDQAARMAKCAARSKLSDRSWLRKTVDGEINSPTQAFAQDRLKRIYVTCGEGANALLIQDGASNELEALTGMQGERTGVRPNIGSAPLGHSVIDRGAFTIYAMKQFAPDLSLTRSQTDDPEVQQRFALREGARNRFRLPVDAAYLQITTCMVRLEPALATRLALSDGPARFGDLQAALVDRTRECVGGARDFQVDPSQFRVYVADAVYRWAVAARNVSSLIPADG